MKTISNYFQCIVFFTLGILSFQAMATEKMLTANFINKAVAKGVADIGAAELALEESSSQEVKAYAQIMIDDNMDINKTLVDLARDKNIQLANSDEFVDKALSLMVTPNEKSFDVAYAKNQLRTHQEKIDWFQRAADSDDYEMRNIATSILPELRRHLLMAEQLVAATAETKTDIYQDRKNQVNTEANPGIDRVPSTDKEISKEPLKN